MNEMSNPFSDYSGDLLVIDSRDIADERVIETMRNIERVGQEQYSVFVSERLEKRSKPLTDPIRQKKFPLIPPARTESKEKQQKVSLKQNCSLFSQLYVSCQVRKGDLDDSLRMKIVAVHHHYRSLGN